MIIKVPFRGFWHCVVDLKGHLGTVFASVRVLPKQVPKLELSTSATEAIKPPIDRLKLEVEASDVEVVNPDYDVFISYASEDIEDVARPLAKRLKKIGLSVWFDKFELHMGSGLRRAIDKGLSKSRFGVLVLSHSFFSKEWPQKELDGLVALDRVLLPIWHNLSREDIE